MSKKISILDLHHQNTPETIAAYLVDSSVGPLLIETGPGSTLPALKQALNDHGVLPTDIRHVLVTHIHFDHAGAAGWWAQHGATVYVHEVGAKHLIDPAKLIASATRIYGDQMDTLWGDILPAPAEKVVALTDQQIIEVGDVQLIAHDTPGHAWHHMCYQMGEIAFTGDAAGVRLNGRSYPDIPAPPPEFKMEVWLNTLVKLRELRLAAIYPTHFGQITEVDAHLDAIANLIQASAQFIRLQMEAGHTRDQIVTLYEAWNRERAVAAGLSDAEFDQYLVANPLYMSVDGMMRYWHKKGIGVDN